MSTIILKSKEQKGLLFGIKTRESAALDLPANLWVEQLNKDYKTT